MLVVQVLKPSVGVGLMLSIVFQIDNSANTGKQCMKNNYYSLYIEEYN